MNARRRRNSDPKAIPKDFVPKWDTRRPAQSWQEQLAVVKQINAALGGTTKGA